MMDIQPKFQVVDEIVLRDAMIFLCEMFSVFGGEKWKSNVLLSAFLCPGYVTRYVKIGTLTAKTRCMGMCSLRVDSCCVTCVTYGVKYVMRN
jgi:hypothetical protein